MSVAATKIQWTDSTWNPTRGCSRVSPGCKNCYAERAAIRQMHGTYAGFVKSTAAGPRWTGKVELVPDALDVPLRWKKRRRIFVNSMSDLFHESLTDGEIDRVFRVMAWVHRHTFQILTKRSARMLDYAGTMADLSREERAHRVMESCGWRLPADTPGGMDWPLPNVWAGCSVENRDTLHRIDDLRETPAAVRFISFEPLLEDLGQVDLRGIHHAIIGGESGPGARPCDLAWIRSLLRQCREAEVAPFIKQVGKWVLGDHEGFGVVQRWLFQDGSSWVPPVIGPNAWRRPDGAVGFGLTDPKGGDPDEWPEDLRVREQPLVAV